MQKFSAYTGFWVDHTHGRIQGATLTVPIEWGNYLISFFTILVSWAGVSAWVIVSYCIYQWRAAKVDEEAMGVQIRVHIRNSTSATHTLIEMLKMALAWRKTGNRVWARTMLIMLAAAATWASFTALGVLVAKVATSNYDAIFVLSKPDICGPFVPEDSTKNGAGADVLVTKYKNDSRTAISYAENWYHGEGSVAISTSPFKSVTLPYNITTGVLCPFGNETRCLGVNGTRDGTAIVMNAGPIDSHVHLGINAPKSDRVTYRRRVTCAPVSVRNFISEVPTLPNNNQSYVDIHIGPKRDLGNITFRWGVSAQFVSGYQLDTVYHLSGAPNESIWTPLPTFLLPDSDMTAIFLALNEVAYYDPVYDPMFLANGTYSTTLDDGSKFYYTSQIFSVMVCGDQHQICNPSNGKCSSFAGRTGFVNIGTSVNGPLGLNAAQRATVVRLYGALTPTGGLDQIVNDMGPQGLQAQNLIRSGSFSTGLPSNQWQIEASRWLEASLVRLQAYMLDWVDHSWVHGKNAQYIKVFDPRKWSPKPTPGSPDADFLAAEVRQCNNQMIRSSGAVQNFSVAGIITIIAVSLSIVILGTALEPIIRRYRKWSGGHAGMQKDLTRDADDQKMLLSLALEAAGCKATWELGSFDVPITKSRVRVPLPSRRPDGMVGYHFVQDYKHNSASPERQS